MTGNSGRVASPMGLISLILRSELAGVRPGSHTFTSQAVSVTVGNRWFVNVGPSLKI